MEFETTEFGGKKKHGIFANDFSRRKPQKMPKIDLMNHNRFVEKEQASQKEI